VFGLECDHAGVFHFMPKKTVDFEIGFQYV